MTLDRRIVALENKDDGAFDATPVDWGRAYAHLPATTKGELRAMLKLMHDSGAGRLPIRGQAARPGVAMAGAEFGQHRPPRA